MIHPPGGNNFPCTTSRCHSPEYIPQPLATWDLWPNDQLFGLEHQQESSSSTPFCGIYTAHGKVISICLSKGRSSDSIFGPPLHPLYYPVFQEYVLGSFQKSLITLNSHGSSTVALRARVRHLKFCGHPQNPLTVSVDSSWFGLGRKDPFPHLRVGDGKETENKNKKKKNTPSLN